MKNNILKSKRGAAIENAVLFMLIIFALCTIIMTLSLVQHYQNKIDEILLKQDIELEQIGEHFLAYLEGDEDSYTKYLADLGEKYKCEIYGDKLVISSKSDKVLLSVKAEITNGKAVLKALNDEEPEDAAKEIGKISNSFLEYLESSDEITTDTFKQCLEETLREKYKYEVIGCALVVKSTDDDSVKLYVRATLNDGTATYSHLRYSEPQNDTLAIDEIGKAFIEHNKSKSKDVFYPKEGYEYTVVGNALTVKNASGTLLYVKNDDDAKDLTWRYGEPTEEEKEEDHIDANCFSYSISFDSEKEVLKTIVTVPQLDEEPNFIVNITVGVAISYGGNCLLSIENVKLNSAPIDDVIYGQSVKIYEFVPKS